MASKKLKRAATVAAGIGAAYLASQALGKKKPTSAEAKGLKITRAKKFGESDEGQMARLDASVKKGLDITRSKPFEASDDASPGTYENVPASKFLSTPGGMGRVTTEQADEMMQGFGPMAKEGKFIKNKIIKAEEGKDIKKTKAAYLAAKNKTPDRITKADIKNAEYALKKGYQEPDVTSTEGSFVRGGSVVSRGNKLARSKPTKLF